MCFFAITFALYIWPVGFLGEDKLNYLTGEGMWTPEYEVYGSGYCQEFSPQYKSLKSISLYFTHFTESAPVEGEIYLTISDTNENVLFHKTLACSEISFGSYFPIELNLSLSSTENYYLTVNFSGEPLSNSMISLQRRLLPRWWETMI